ncbi:MAG: class I SAM-dependent RNA methyltransferase [Myxococcales bacterium]|nr:class I SAM-dependent RNA methyltransferase [Myxococcales bacterium]
MTKAPRIPASLPVSSPRLIDAIVAPGLESIAKDELARLGARDLEASPGVVRGRADDATLFRCNLGARTITRLLEVVAEGPCRRFDELEKLAARVDWRRFGTRVGPIEVKATASRSRLYHSGAIAERVEGVVKAALGASSTGAPPLRVHVRVDTDVVTLSVDSSGDRLHRRGYRLDGAAAPLRETLAAGILLLLEPGLATSDAPPSVFDPMCGSGTFPIEAAWMAMRRAPGLDVPLLCSTWPGLGDVAKRASSELAGATRTLPMAVTGMDRNPLAVSAARANAERAGVAVDWLEGDADWAHPGDTPPGLVICNPPYGHRIGGADRVLPLLERLAARFDGWRVAALWPGVPRAGWEERARLNNGGIRVSVVEWVRSRR